MWIYYNSLRFLILMKIDQGFLTGGLMAKTGPPTIFGWPFVNFEIETQGQWCSFGPQTYIFEQALALYGLP